MRNVISRQALAALALLSSSVGFAATVTLVPSTNDLAVGSVYVDVYGSGFPDTTGATLRLTFNSGVVSVRTPTTTNGIVIPAGSPFTFVAAASPFSSGDIFSVLAPLTGPLPTGNFGGFPAFRINFQFPGGGGGEVAGCFVEHCPLSAANIALVDDQSEFSWSNGATALPIPVTYTWVPAPAAALLFPSALGLLGWVRRKAGNAIVVEACPTA